MNICKEQNNKNSYLNFFFLMKTFLKKIHIAATANSFNVKHAKKGEKKR